MLVLIQTRPLIFNHDDHYEISGIKSKNSEHFWVADHGDQIEWIELVSIYKINYISPQNPFIIREFSGYEKRERVREKLNRG